MAHSTGPIATETQIPCRTLVTGPDGAHLLGQPPRCSLRPCVWGGRESGIGRSEVRYSRLPEGAPVRRVHPSNTLPSTEAPAPRDQPIHWGMGGGGATGLRKRGNNTSRSTGRSGRQKAATRRNMRREERGTVQGPVKEQQPDGMSHRGGLSDPLWPRPPDVAQKPPNVSNGVPIGGGGALVCQAGPPPPDPRMFASVGDAKAFFFKLLGAPLTRAEMERSALLRRPLGLVDVSQVDDPSPPSKPLVHASSLPVVPAAKRAQTAPARLHCPSKPPAATPAAPLTPSLALDDATQVDAPDQDSPYALRYPPPPPGGAPCAVRALCEKLGMSP